MGIADGKRARIEALLEGGRVAEALDLAEGLSAPEFEARAWLIVGNVRALRRVAPDLRGELRLEVDDALANGLAMKPIPDGTYEDLASAAAGLGEQGRVHELLLHHLAMAGVAPRVDWRVLHVEHASTLALQLGDGGLRALVALFEALLATFLGEDEDAIEYAGQAKELAAGTREPRATAITHCAELLASGRTITPAIDMLWSAGVRIEPFAWGLTSSEPSPDAREGG